MSSAADASQARPAGWPENAAGSSLQAVYGTTLDPSGAQLPLLSGGPGGDPSAAWTWQQPPAPPPSLGASSPADPGSLLLMAPSGIGGIPPPAAADEERKQRELLEYLEREFEKGERAYERELQRRRKLPPGAAAPAASGGSDGSNAAAQAMKLTFECTEELQDGDDPAIAPPPPQKKRKGSSRFRGVVRKEVPGKEVRVRWRAEMTLHGKSTWLGYYESEEQAARVFDVATIFHKARRPILPSSLPRSFPSLALPHRHRCPSRLETNENGRNPHKRAS